MAKYKYDVYEVERSNELVYQNVTNTDSVNVRNGCNEYTPDLKNKIFKRGPMFGGMSSIPKGYFVCARRYNGRWTVFVSGDYTEEYCFKEESRGRKLYRIETVEKQGSFIETIVADENAYPTNGTKDGKWYVRKEIVQEHKISFKDPGDKLINIASIYFKDNKSNILNIAKAYSDKKLVWEKSNSKSSEKLIITKEKGSYYSFRCNSWSEISPNKKYRITTDKPGSQYVISVNNKDYPIKNNDIFTLRSACDFKIANTNYSYFTLKIYETEEEANITI